MLTAFEWFLSSYFVKPLTRSQDDPYELSEFNILKHLIRLNSTDWAFNVGQHGYVAKQMSCNPFQVWASVSRSHMCSSLGEELSGECMTCCPWVTLLVISSSFSRFDPNGKAHCTYSIPHLSRYDTLLANPNRTKLLRRPLNIIKLTLAFPT